MEICSNCQSPKVEEQAVLTKSCELVSSSENVKSKIRRSSFLGNKLASFREKLDSGKQGYSQCSKIDHADEVPSAKVCRCSQNTPSDENESWYHTWPERVNKDKVKTSPTKKPPLPVEIKDNSIPVEVLLEKVPLVYDPFTKQLCLMKPAVTETRAMGHCRQPSIQSTLSNSSGELQLPLINHHPQSYPSLSSLSNLSSSTDRTNSLERGGEPPRFGGLSFWQRAPWRIFGRAAIFQRIGGNSGMSSGTTTPGTPLGSQGLILEGRPSNLPAKCASEALHHEQLHQRLLQESHKREVQKALESEKQREEQRRLEEQVAMATKVWANEILPNWETSRKSRKTRQLWWSGLPPSVRGQVWRLSIGNDLNVTADLFEMCRARAKETLASGGVGFEASVDLIQLDLSRTFPHLGFFQVDGPYYASLGDLLGAYACFRPDIGYVQGMSFVGAMLLLNMDLAEAFCSFANLLNRPLLHAFFRMEQSKMTEYYAAFQVMLKSHLPKLHAHLTSLALTPDLYLQEWIYTLFSRSLPLDVSSRVWDLYCRDGDDFLFRTAIGILKLLESSLLELDFINCAQLLTNLPEEIEMNALFRAIDQVQIQTEKSKFTQMFAMHLARVKGHGS